MSGSHLRRPKAQRPSETNESLVRSRDSKHDRRIVKPTEVVPRTIYDVESLVLCAYPENG